MKIKIDYQHECRPTDADVLVLLPGQEIETDTGYLDACRRFAAKNAKTAVVTAPFVKNGSIVMAYMHGKQEILQPACFLPPAGYEAYKTGDDAVVFDTPYGRAAMAVLYDVFQPQFARLCALRGCDVLFCAPPAQYGTQDYILAGPWSVAQANSLAVSAAGKEHGQLIVPCALSDDNSGLSKDNTVDIKDLDRFYDLFPVFDSLNASFYERYKKELTQ